MKIAFFKRLLILILFVYLLIYSGWTLSHKSTVVNILMPAPFADSTSTIVDEFNKENHGKINIKVTRGPLETEAVSDLAISSLLLGNSPFDILLMDVTWLPKYAASDWLIPLDELIDSEDWESLEPGAKLGNSYKDRIYRWPMVADIGLLYWRKDLMKNPPNTPKELIEIGLDLLGLVCQCHGLRNP